MFIFILEERLSYLLLSSDISQRYVMFFFFQAEDGIRDLVRSRGLGDVYKRQVYDKVEEHTNLTAEADPSVELIFCVHKKLFPVGHMG